MGATCRPARVKTCCTPSRLSMRATNCPPVTAPIRSSLQAHFAVAAGGTVPETARSTRGSSAMELVAQLIEALKHNAKHFGPELAKTAFRRGLSVTAKDGSEKPIP